VNTSCTRANTHTHTRCEGRIVCSTAILGLPPRLLAHSAVQRSSPLQVPAGGLRCWLANKGVLIARVSDQLLRQAPSTSEVEMIDAATFIRDEINQMSARRMNVVCRLYTANDE
jgi:hypothetical protein